MVLDDVATHAGMHALEQVGSGVPGCHWTFLKLQARGFAPTHKGPEIADNPEPVFNHDPVGTTDTKYGVGVSGNSSSDNNGIGVTTHRQDDI